MAIYMFDAEKFEFKFSRLRRHLKPTQFQGQIGPLFETDLYFMEICRIAILIPQCSAFLDLFLKKIL